MNIYQIDYDITNSIYYGEAATRVVIALSEEDIPSVTRHDMEMDPPYTVTVIGQAPEGTEPRVVCTQFDSPV